MSNDTSIKSYIPNKNSVPHGKKLRKINQWLKSQINRQLEKIEYGQLIINDDGETNIFSGSSNSSLTATIDILDDQFYWYIAFGGGVGAGEAYINGYWKSNDLTKVIQLFAVNQTVMDSMEEGLARITKPIKRLFHWLNRNTQSGSKSNILAHYDLGNQFFSLFLDQTMMYSSGIFYQQDQAMKQASLNKLERICRRLKLKEDDHVLEIGTGWGGFAIYAASQYGCRVTTTTISNEQYEYTQNKIEKAKLSHRITLLNSDYRDLTGQYDKLVSIEMIEAVGHQYYDTFFNQCSQLLSDNGEMLLQAITITDQRYDSARQKVDFIKRYIFPGSCIPSINAISKSLTKSTNLRITNMDDMGTHYATTLKKWREAFEKNKSELEKQGFNDQFYRMWQYYLCYCEGGFREQVISACQLHLVKPRALVAMELSKIG